MDKDFMRLLRGVDKSFLVAVGLCCIYGIVMVFSATRTLDNSAKYMIVQVLAFILGSVGMYFTMTIDYEGLASRAKIIYIISVCLLLVVIPFGMGGKEVGGQRWQKVGFLGFQPSEFAKLGYIIAMARLIEKNKEDINRFKVLGKIFMFAGIMIILILIQPDIGTALVYITILICMLLAAGLHYRYIPIAGGIIAAIMPLIWFFVLKPYQKDRILVFLDPAKDPGGSGYQVTQSEISIGSGQLTGSGFLHGTQTQLGLLPAKQTDFIFGVVGEELGLIGSVLVVALLFFLIAKCFIAAKEAKNTFGSFLCVGVGAMLLFHAFENIGMCIGIMPVTGIPLPFFSYGGSALLTNMLCMGLVMNVWIRRKAINF